MKRLLFSIILVLLMGGLAVAQNHFVYLRYDPRAGSPKPIVEMVEQLFSQRVRNQVLVFLSTNDRSLLARTELEWLDIRGELYTMQSTPEFYAHNDMVLLTQLFHETLGTTVGNGMRLKGSADAQWTCHFVIPQEMFVSEDMESILQLISLNELPSRLSVTVQTYDAGSELHFIQALPNGKLTNYGFTVQRSEEYERPAADSTVTEEEEVLPEGYDFSAFDAKLGTAYVGEDEESDAKGKKSKKTKKSKKGSEESTDESTEELLPLVDTESDVAPELVEGSVLPDEEVIPLEESETVVEDDGKKDKKVKKEKAAKVSKEKKSKKSKNDDSSDAEVSELPSEDFDLWSDESMNVPEEEESAPKSSKKKGKETPVVEEVDDF